VFYDLYNEVTYLLLNYFIFLFTGRSYNQPNFCTYAAWNPDATTFADNTTVGTNPNDVYITINNTVYVAETNLNQVQVWLQGSSIPTTTFSAGLNSPYSVFASILGDIYIDNGAVNGRVDEWASNATNSTVEMYSNGICYDLFFDIYDNLFCSLNSLHQVIKKSFNDNANTTTIAAGNGINGSGSYMLNGPRGIFVDIKFNLYVADCGNNRIQFYQSGQLNGTTVIQNGTSGTFILSCPTGLVLDADGYIFITDNDNNRVVASGPNGYRCIVGCSGSGSAANELYGPRSLSFDSYGNIFVVDTGNGRIQKFFLATNSCCKYMLINHKSRFP
jgi:tripartite motif-containing protein 71